MMRRGGEAFVMDTVIRLEGYRVEFLSCLMHVLSDPYWPD